MNIADISIQDKIPKSLLVLVAILLSGAAGIGIGMLMAHDGAGKQDTFWIEQLPAEELAGSVGTSSAAEAAPSKASIGSNQAAAAAASITSVGEVVASKTGTVYYLPSCSGVSRILPTNRVTYATRAEAEAKGLKPAKNCKGL